MLRACEDEAEVFVLLRLHAEPGSERTLGPAVWLLAIAETISWGLLYYTFGVLLAPMAERAAAPEAEVAIAFSLALLAAGIAAPVVGRAVDRRGPGPVMTLGAGLGALGFVALGLARSTGELYAVWTLLGLAHACTSYEPAFAAVTRWFEDLTARRRALLLLTSIAGFASTVFVPFAAWIVATRGLRVSVWTFAALLGVVVAPMHLALARIRAPARVPSAHRAVPLPHSESRRSELATLAIVFAMHAFTSTGATLFLFPSLVARHVSAPDAAMLVGLVGAAQVPARLLYEPMCRWIPSRARLAALLLLQACALAGWGALTGGGRVLALVTFGAANGLATLERATLVSDWFGARGYGARSGVVAAASSFTRAGAPLAVAFLVSHGSYPSAFAVLAALLLVAACAQLAAEAVRVGRATERSARRGGYG